MMKYDIIIKVQIKVTLLLIYDCHSGRQAGRGGQADEAAGGHAEVHQVRETTMNKENM